MLEYLYFFGLWYLVGISTVILSFMIDYFLGDEIEINLKDLLIILLISILGPILTMILLSHLIKNSSFLGKNILKIKRPHHKMDK